MRVTFAVGCDSLMLLLAVHAGMHSCRRSGRRSCHSRPSSRPWQKREGSRQRAAHAASWCPRSAASSFACRRPCLASSALHAA